jgi:hypothetical protein
MTRTGQTNYPCRQCNGQTEIITIKSRPHLPCLPAAIEEAQLPLAKPAGAGEASRNPESGLSSQQPEQRPLPIENPSSGAASTSSP